MADANGDDVQKMHAMRQRLLQSTAASNAAQNGGHSPKPKTTTQTESSRIQQPPLNEDRMDIDDESRSVTSMPILPSYPAQSSASIRHVEPVETGPRSSTTVSAAPVSQSHSNGPSLFGSADQLAVCPLCSLPDLRLM